MSGIFIWPLMIFISTHYSAIYFLETSPLGQPVMSILSILDIIVLFFVSKFLNKYWIIHLVTAIVSYLIFYILI